MLLPVRLRLALTGSDTSAPPAAVNRMVQPPTFLQ